MTQKQPIPRRIIQTAKTRNLSPLAKAAATNLRLLHPDWEHVFFDDADVVRFVVQSFPQYQAVFHSFPRAIQRVDFFRYLAVFHFGGFYFDLDVFLADEISPLVPCGCVFPFEELTLSRYLRTQCGTDWEIGNYAFGATAGHPFLGAIINNCVRAQSDPAWVAPLMKGIPALFRSEFYVLNTTGPGLVTRTLAENADLAKTVTVQFPEDVCDSRTWHQFGKFGVHLMSASWRQRGNIIWRKLALLWEARLRRRLLAESRAMGQARSFPAVRIA